MISAELVTLFKPDTPYHHVYCTDKNHRMMGCNDQQAIDTGWLCEQDIIGKYPTDLTTHTEDGVIYVTNNEKVLKTGLAHTCIEPFTKKDGKIVLYKTYKTPLKNDKGNVIGVMGMSVQINDSITTVNNALDLLSPQQLKCFQLLTKGFLLKQIAHEMNLTYKTIEHYMSHIRKKLNCKNTRELIANYANR